MPDQASPFAYSDPLLDLLDRTTTLNTINEVDQTIADAYAQLGFTHFGFHATDGGGFNDDAGVRFGRPPTAWLEHYLDQRLFEHDELSARRSVCIAPFTWRDALADSMVGPQAQDVLDRAGDFGVRDGFIVPWRRIPGKEGAVVVASERPLERSAELRGKLLLISLYFAAAGFRLSRHDSEAPVRLTPRQRECLQWIAAGKTVWEIGQILTLSEHTVLEHLEAARLRIGARTRTQAAVLALAAGLIHA